MDLDDAQRNILDAAAVGTILAVVGHTLGLVWLGPGIATFVFAFRTEPHSVSRIAVTLDEHARSQLAKRAEAAGEPVARTAARLIQDGLLSTHAARPDRPGAKQRADDGGKAEAPSWLEPQSSQERWRRELWSAVCALAARYPRTFRALSAEWWRDRALIEVLGALAAWRAQLDSGEGADPRAELLFHDRLELLQRSLTEGSDPTGPRFSRGPPPLEWVA